MTSESKKSRCVQCSKPVALGWRYYCSMGCRIRDIQEYGQVDIFHPDHPAHRQREAA